MNETPATKHRKRESDVDAALRIARELHPDVYERANVIARIIDPSAFMDGWIVEPEESAALLDAKLKYKQSAALSRAHEILTYLGVNTETDWYEILDRLAKQA